MDWKNKQYQENIAPEKKLKLLQFDFTGKSVIDLGCNIGMVAEYVLSRGASAYYGIDNNPEYQPYWKDTEDATFELKDLKDLEILKADVIMAIGIFHHLSDDELRELIPRLKCKTIIIEAPTKGQSNNYNVRSISEYVEMFSWHRSGKIMDSGFLTPPVRRTIMVFKRNG